MNLSHVKTQYLLAISRHRYWEVLSNEMRSHESRTYRNASANHHEADNEREDCDDQGSDRSGDWLFNRRDDDLYFQRENSFILLKTSLDIICTFLFDSNDRRAVDLFKVTAAALTALALEKFLKDDELSSIALTTSSIVLQRIVNLNQSAQIIANFTSIANTISICISKQLSLYVVRRSLVRIRHCLDLDTLMTSFEHRSNKLQNDWAVFELSQNLPGMLFEQSSRHDNDHENIRDIKILSIAEKIQSHRLEYFSSNDLTRNHLFDLKDLLDRQFRLLREDTID